MRRSDRFMLLAMVTALLLACLAEGQETNVITDDKGRITRIDYPEGNDITYEYFGDSDNVKTVRVGNEDAYEYDEAGNVIKETHASAPEYNRVYTYYPDGTLRSVSSKESTVSFTYDDEARVAGRYTQVGNVTLSELYAYDADGNVISVETAQGYTEYEYDADGNVVVERVVDTTGAAPAIVETRYEYDVNGNIVKATDSNGVEVSWGYERVPFSCMPEGCEGVECGETATCYYSRLASRTVGNYRVELDYSGDGVAYRSGNESYAPKTVYDGEGRIVDDGRYTYEYGSGYYTRTDKASGERITYELGQNGEVMRAQYANGDSAEYLYSPTGEVVIVDRTYQAESGQTTVRYYATKPGDVGSLVAESALAGHLGGGAPTGPAGGPVTPAEPAKPGAGPDYLMLAILSVVAVIAILAIKSRRRRA